MPRGASGQSADGERSAGRLRQPAEREQNVAGRQEGAPLEAGETIEGLSDAVARKAGVIIQDDGTAVDKIVQVLVEAKVI